MRSIDVLYFLVDFAILVLLWKLYSQSTRYTVQPTYIPNIEATVLKAQKRLQAVKSR